MGTPHPESFHRRRLNDLIFQRPSLALQACESGSRPLGREASRSAPAQSQYVLPREFTERLFHEGNAANPGDLVGIFERRFSETLRFYYASQDRSSSRFFAIAWPLQSAEAGLQPTIRLGVVVGCTHPTPGGVTDFRRINQRIVFQGFTYLLTTLVL